jgi:pimeloyl-ACP methyl ester carboxylesterase
VPTLARHFTVVVVDRRGRGDSGDAPGYAIEREAEDVAAVIDAIGEPVHLLGHSYGGVVALQAALRSDGLRSLALYEPPIGFDGLPEALIAELDELITAGAPAAAVELFMGETVGLPADVLAELRADTAAWRPMVDSAHTLPRELRSVADFRFDPGRYGDLSVPTVLLAGTDSPPELHVGVEILRAALGAPVRMMPGVDHEAVTTGPAVLSAAIIELLRAEVAR